MECYPSSQQNHVDESSFSPLFLSQSNPVTPKSEEVPKFRSRYSADETSEEAYEKDLKLLRFHRRKKRASEVLIAIIGVLMIGVIARVYIFFAETSGRLKAGLWGSSHKYGQDNNFHSWKWLGKGTNEGSNSVASRESYGFFNDIPDDNWMKLKLETKQIRDSQSVIVSQSQAKNPKNGGIIDPIGWHIDNWKEDFMCDSRINIAGKMLCNPARIISLADECNRSNEVDIQSNSLGCQCRVYVSGGNDLEFANQFLDFSLARTMELYGGQTDRLPNLCEVHVFHPDRDNVSVSRDGLFVHPWGFHPNKKSRRNIRQLRARNNQNAARKKDSEIAEITNFKTFDETINELGHTGKAISILALDCEGCEWDIYEDLLSTDVSIHQMLLQMHGVAQNANEFFLAVQTAGYVTFHKQSIPGGNNDVYDYSFLKLSRSYYENLNGS